MLSQMQIFLAKKEIAVKVAAAEAQWENGHNEAAGRRLYEGAITMCHGAGLQIDQMWLMAVTCTNQA